MKKLGLLCGIIALLFANFSCEKSDNLSIMSFNIRYGDAPDGDNAWENRQDILIDCLKKYNPDILAVQEAFDFQIEKIQSAFPDWDNFGLPRFHKKEMTDPVYAHESMGGESVNIFYNKNKFKLLDSGTFWHSDTPDIPASITWGNSLPRIHTWGLFQAKDSGQKFVVLNTHFHTNAREPYTSKTTNLVMRKWREIAGDLPTIMTGDFNLSPDSDTHEIFCGRQGSEEIRGNFVDCWQVLNNPEVNAGTSHNFKGVRNKVRIDWILATPSIKPQSIEIIYDNVDGRYPSDHYPVLARLAF